MAFDETQNKVLPILEMQKLKEKDNVNTLSFRIYLFDVMYLNGEEMWLKTQRERRTVLDKLKKVRNVEVLPAEIVEGATPSPRPTVRWNKTTENEIVIDEKTLETLQKIRAGTLKLAALGPKFLGMINQSPRLKNKVRAILMGKSPSEAASGWRNSKKQRNFTNNKWTSSEPDQKQIYYDYSGHKNTIERLFKKSKEAGHEGLILKNAGAHYNGAARRNWVKFKYFSSERQETIDLVVMGGYKGKVG